MCPGFDPRAIRVGFVVDKMIRGRFSLNKSISPVNSHFTNLSIFINHPVTECTVTVLNASLNKKRKGKGKGKKTTTLTKARL
jgi:hypothetical protein